MGQRVVRKEVKVRSTGSSIDCESFVSHGTRRMYESATYRRARTYYRAQSTSEVTGTSYRYGTLRREEYKGRRLNLT